MTRLVTILLCLLASGVARSDVWKWVDAHGNTHFVDSDHAIYTWVDAYGKVHYSDKPGHEDAVSVQLVWHSAGSLDDVEQGQSAAPSAAEQDPDETPSERQEREQAEAYYCNRAREIYDSYRNAPRLYRTVDGERQYLSDEQAADTLAETKARVDELCNSAG